MTIALHSLNYPPHVLGYMNKHRSQYATRTSPALAFPPSSILLQTDDIQVQFQQVAILVVPCSIKKIQ
ncbi:hypothetical protein CsSME_00052415 [Camellia sinensis var. sinensis]